MALYIKNKAPGPNGPGGTDSGSNQVTCSEIHSRGLSFELPLHQGKVT